MDAHKAFWGTINIDWLSTNWVLRRFKTRKRDVRKEYRRFVSRGSGEQYRKEFHTGNKGGVVLGHEEFIVKLPEFGKLKLK